MKRETQTQVSRGINLIADFYRTQLTDLIYKLAYKDRVCPHCLKIVPGYLQQDVADALDVDKSAIARMYPKRRKDEK